MIHKVTRVYRRGVSFPRGVPRAVPTGRWLGRGSVLSLLAAALLTFPTAGGTATHHRHAARSGWSRLSQFAAAGSSPRVLMSTSGNSLLVWEHHGSVLVRPLSRSGALGATQVVWPSSAGQLAGQNGPGPLRMSANGQALIIFWSHRAWFERTRSANGTVGPLLALPNPGMPNQSQVIDAVVAPDGTATVLMSAVMHPTGPSGSYYYDILYLLNVNPDGTLGTPVVVDTGDQSTTVSSGYYVGDSHLGVDSSGNVDMAWVRGPVGGQTCCNQLWTRTLAAAGTLGPAVPVSPNGTDVWRFQIEVSPDGRRTFVWGHLFDQHFAHFQEDVEARSVTSAGGFGPVITLSPLVISHETSSGTVGSQLWAMSVAPLARGAAVTVTIATTLRKLCAGCVLDERFRLVERNVINGRAGPGHQLVTSTYAAFNGGLHVPLPLAGSSQLAGSGSTAIVSWEIRLFNPSGTLKRGIAVESVSAAGIIGPVTTPLPVGTLDNQALDYDVAGDANGHEVAVAATRRHGLEFTKRG